MKDVDVLIIGAGKGGFIAALNLLKNNYSVCILDEHNEVSGLSPLIKKGRFTFVPSIHHLYLNDSTLESYGLGNVLKELNIKNNILFSKIEDSIKIFASNNEYVLPLGVNNFINKIEEYVPGSKESLEVFFDLALECKKALDYISINDDYDFDYIKDNFSNFMRVAPYSLSKVLDALDVPLHAQELLNACFVYFGSSETDISFCQYAAFLYDYINNGISIPTEFDYGILYALYEEYLESKGLIKFDSKVDKIIVEDNEVNGLCLKDGTKIYANHVIFNGSFTTLYGSLIDPSVVPRRALQFINQREDGLSVFGVMLGLNRSMNELGIDAYSSFIYDSLDTDVVMSSFGEINHGSQIALCLNKVNSEISAEGTCVLELFTFYSKDTFSKYLDGNIIKLKEDIANYLINSYEKNTGIKIRDFIEEIEIISPLEYASLVDMPNGSLFDYHIVGNDNLLPRIMNKKNEKFIRNLYCINGFSGDLFGYDSVFIKGLEASKMTIKDLEVK